MAQLTTEIALPVRSVSAAWDALRPDSFFASARWLSAVEGALSPESAAIIVRDKRQRPVAGMAAYLVRPDSFALVNPPKLVTSPDLREELARLQSPDDRRLLDRLVGTIAPQLADSYPIAVCVCPFTCTAAIVGLTTRPDVVDALLDGIGQVAARWGARASAILYVGADRCHGLVARLRRRGYLSSTLSALCLLRVEWQTIQQCLASPEWQRRWRVRELRAADVHGLEVETVDGSCLARLVDELAPLYAKLQGRHGHASDLDGARATLEWIGAEFADVTRTVVVRQGGRALAFGLFFDVGDTLHTYIAGQTYDEAARHSFAYFHATYYGLVEFAIRRGVQQIDYGIGSYEWKTRRGCVLRPLTCFFDFPGVDRDLATRALDMIDQVMQRGFESAVRGLS